MGVITPAIGKTLITNLIVNGKLDVSAAYWTATSATLSMESGSLKVLPTADNTDHNAAQVITTAPIAGHKYYVRATISGWSGGKGRFTIWNVKSDGATEYAVSDGYTTEGSPSTIFSVTSVNATPSMYLRLVVLNESNIPIYAGAGEYALFKNVIVIDLTAHYGAGNEPTKEQVDALIEAFGGWFDGSESLIQIPKGTYRKQGISGYPEIWMEPIMKKAKGRIASSATTLSFKSQTNANVSKNYITISLGSLSFIPSRIIVYDTVQRYHTICAVGVQLYPGASYKAEILVAYSTPAYFQIDGTSAFVSTGFRLPVQLASSEYEWEAYE